MRGDSLDAAILATVAYGDVFAYAPTPAEIHRFLIGHRARRSEVEWALGHSADLRRAIGTRSGVWFMRDKDHLAPRRVRFAQHSQRLWPVARAMAARVERSGLALAGLVTGSLAADNADEHADIDFLFVYPSGRTFSSFAALRMLAKVPGLGLSIMCPNYALSADRLEIRPQNLFTAHELAKAVPLFGYDVYAALIRANRWVSRYLPNALPLLDGPADRAFVEPAPRGVLERAFRLPPLSTLERLERERKFAADRRDVGVDMSDRAKKGSMDRHSPTRSFHALCELRYRMSQLGIEGHPLFAEIAEATRPLADEMSRWGEEQLASDRPNPALTVVEPQTGT